MGEEEEEKEADSSSGLNMDGWNLAERRKEIIDLVKSLDDLDKAAWQEIIDHAESKTREELNTAIDDNEEFAIEVWKEIAPHVKLIRLGLASGTISRNARCTFVGMIISEISALLSPVELAGVCLSRAFKHLCLSGEGKPPIVIPIPFRDMEFERKKDETRSVV